MSLDVSKFGFRPPLSWSTSNGLNHADDPRRKNAQPKTAKPYQKARAPARPNRAAITDQSSRITVKLYVVTYQNLEAVRSAAKASASATTAVINPGIVARGRATIAAFSIDLCAVVA